VIGGRGEKTAPAGGASTIAAVPRRVLVVSAAVLIVCGVTARFVHLGRLFYYHDEAATSLRISGHTASDYGKVVTGRLVTARQVAAFQRPGGGIADTVHSLAVDDPQHPPLFFVLARLWSGAIGSSPASLRALAAVLGVLFLGCAAWLVEVLFRSRLVTVVAVTLLAISPFEILYSDVAREYSLWLATIAASGAALVTATRRATVGWWAAYAALLTCALYSFTNTVFLLVGQALFVALVARRQLFRRFLPAAALASALFLPWVAEVAAHRGAFDSGTNWTREAVSFGALLRSWLVVQGIDVVDNAHAQARLDPTVTLLYAAVLALHLVACFVLLRRAPRPASIFLATTFGAAVLPLAAADVVSGGIRSTIPRYLAPAYLVLTVALGFLIALGLRAAGTRPRAAALAVAAAVVAAAAGSYAARAGHDVWWTQDDGAAAENLAVARLVERSPEPVVVSTGFGTMLELSHYLPPATPIRFVADGREPALPQGARTIVVYGSPANGAAAARLEALLADIRRRGRLVVRPSTPALPCCGAGIVPIPRQLWLAR
jgi:uncharacterized membrane protein